MKPTVGGILLYELSEQDASQINRRRNRLSAIQPMSRHIGVVESGLIVPMIVTAVDESLVNGQVFLDGGDSLWVERVSEGMGPTCWSWPPRV